MSEFEPIPEEIPRQSRSAQKDGGSSDRKSKSSDKHAVKEKKSRSSKNRSSSKGDSPPSGQGGHGHGRLGSNGSSKSGSKHKSEPLISLTSTAEMDMGLPETNNVHGTVLCFINLFFFINLISFDPVILLLLFFFSYCGLAVRWMENVTICSIAQRACYYFDLLFSVRLIIPLVPSFRSYSASFFHVLFSVSFFHCAFILFSSLLFGSYFSDFVATALCDVILKQMIVTDVFRH